MKLMSLLSILKVDPCEVHLVVGNIQNNVYIEGLFRPESPISIYTSEALIASKMLCEKPLKGTWEYQTRNISLLRNQNQSTKKIVDGGNLYGAWQYRGVKYIICLAVLFVTSSTSSLPARYTVTEIKFDAFVSSLAQSRDSKLCKNVNAAVPPLSHLKEKLQVFWFSNKMEFNSKAESLFTFQDDRRQSQFYKIWYYYPIIRIPCDTCQPDRKRHLTYIFEKSMSAVKVGEVVNGSIQLGEHGLEKPRKICRGWTCFRGQMESSLSPEILYVAGFLPVQLKMPHTYIILEFLKSNKNLTFRNCLFHYRKMYNTHCEGYGYPFLSELTKRGDDTRLSDSSYSWEEMLFFNTPGFNFITCWSQTPFRFQILLSPYQIECWIAVCMTTLILTLLFRLYVKMFHPILKGPFTAQLILIASLFEKSVPWPNTLLHPTSFRISIGLVSLVSIVLTQGYIGVLITSLSSPFPPIRITHFDNLTTFVCNLGCKGVSTSNTCPRNIWNDSNGLIKKLYGSRIFDNEKDFKIFAISQIKYNISTVHPHSPDIPIHQFYDDIATYLKEKTYLPTYFNIPMERYSQITDKSNSTRLDILLYSLLHPNHFFHPGFTIKRPVDVLVPAETIIVNELGKCERTVWVDEEDKIQDAFAVSQVSVKISRSGFSFYF
ncbi:hypothetical protein Fcan01_28337 [Folsomia candida]|uniref:Uncharacterized protein n=1 Tax=Folsomia candida TaxID=158441 RepID=A0A226CWK3_FOLCA|nr:hypothetical protein Fcan01_28337 [Folsomia candida]